MTKLSLFVFLVVLTGCEAMNTTDKPNMVSPKSIVIKVTHYPLNYTTTTMSPNHTTTNVTPSKKEKDDALIHDLFVLFGVIGPLIIICLVFSWVMYVGKDKFRTQVMSCCSKPNETSVDVVADKATELDDNTSEGPAPTLNPSSLTPVAGPTLITNHYII